MAGSGDTHPGSNARGVSADAIVLSSPFEVHLKITDRCNLRCWHCHSNAGPGSDVELSIDEIKALCIELADWGVHELAVSGGEPFLRDDCMKIIQAAVQAGLHVKINTNGTLLSSPILRGLATIGIRQLMVSLDGATASVHDSIRGSKGAFDSAVRAVGEAVRRGFQVMLRMTVGQVNWRQIHDFVHLADALGVNTIGLTPVLPLGRAVRDYGEKGIALGEWQHIALEARHAVADSNCRLVDTFSFFDFKPEESDLPTGLAAYLVGCKAGKTLVSIDHEGRIWPCSLLHSPSTELGNIRRQSLRDVWLHSEVLRKFREVSPVSLGSPCCDCSFVWQCMGGCRAYAMAATGCPIAPDPRCPRTLG